MLAMQEGRELALPVNKDCLIVLAEAGVRQDALITSTISQKKENTLTEK